MSKEKSMDVKDDPDTYLIDLSVPEVRAYEQKTRTAIETQKKELRAMVGEQYQDLISAADAIISMSKNAQAIKLNFDKMQSACDVDQIKSNSKNITQIPQENKKLQESEKRKYVYTIATLVKSLADVPEQIWHALENHRYLHASRLYTLAEKVHDYLEEEKQKSTIDIEIAFPIIQRQWDAVSAFKPQIIQRASYYLRVSEQSSEHIAEVIVGLMLLDGLSYKESLEKLLEMRKSAICDILQQYTKSTDKIEHKISHQIRELTLVIKRSVVQLFEIFVSKEGQHQYTLLESYVHSFRQTFLIPSKTSHGNETPSQSAITRLFSPSSNVPLIVRFIPDSVQHAKPTFQPQTQLDLRSIQTLVASWMDDLQLLLTEKLSALLAPITSQHELLQIRSRVWELLAEDEKVRTNLWTVSVQALFKTRYSVWHHLYRTLFNTHAIQMIDRALLVLIDQLETVVWEALVDPDQAPHKSFAVTSGIWPESSGSSRLVFSLPNLSSSKEIEEFKSSLKETAYDRTPLLCSIQNTFDNTLDRIRKDVLNHLVNYDHGLFHAKEDTDRVKSYYENKCFDVLVNYANGLEALMERLKDWKDQRNKNDLSISLGRYAKNIATLSKQVPKSISLSPETAHVFELRSSINRGPRYKEIQDRFMSTFHKAHQPWISGLRKEFSQRLKTTLLSTQWNDQCFAISVWDNVEEDMKLPTQATHAFVRSLFYLCEEIQRINSTILDMAIMTQLRQELYEGAQEVFQKNIKDLDLTENGSLQLIFDYMFITTVLQQEGKLSSSTALEFLESQIDPINWASYEPHFKPNVNKFYIKQSLIFGVLTSASSETYERARKTISSQQQGQYNVLPMAPQSTRFTLLPIGHLASSTIRTR